MARRERCDVILGSGCLGKEKGELMADQSFEQRFWSKVDKSGECWIWTRATFSNGYGHLGQNGRSKLAHRVAWELTYGPIPAGMLVLHRCDNRVCVKPKHLFLGTHLDNTLDGLLKGRIARFRPKLTIATVRLIRDLRLTGLSYQVIANRLGLSISHVCAICRGTAWGWLR